MRRAAAGILALTAILGAATIRVDASIPPSQALEFAINRGTTNIGRHSVTWTRRGRDLHAEIEIDISVSFLFMTAFRYSHRNHEIWRDGRLVSIDTRTDDNGDQYTVRGRATSEGFVVEGSSGRFVAPSGIVPTSYWMPETTRQAVLLDTQHGRLAEVAITPRGTETIDTEDGPTTAARFDMTGDLELSLWYTPAGEWVKVAFEARGETVEYRLRDMPPAEYETARETMR